MKSNIELEKNVYALSKENDENEIRAYFEKVFELSKSNNEFPVDLDEVWPLVYGRKEDAVRGLTSGFLQDVDYQILRTNAEKSTIGRPALQYKISTPCLEYFVARKVRTVFEVYRKVFHKHVERCILPDFENPIIAARAWADIKESEQLAIHEKYLALNESRILSAENKELQPKVEILERIAGTNGLVTMSQAVKILQLPYGRNTLFSKLKERGIFFKNCNEPKQSYIQRGFFKLKVKIIDNEDEEEKFGVNVTMVTKKGLEFLAGEFVD